MFKYDKYVYLVKAGNIFMSWLGLGAASMPLPVIICTLPFRVPLVGGSEMCQDS